jgi:hypothetical protein
MFRRQLLFGLTALWSGFATIASAEVRLEGSPGRAGDYEQGQDLGRVGGIFRPLQSK